MEVLKIIISGLIDGITGFLPISSSGHLAVLRNVLDFGVEDSVLFDIFLKLASIIVIMLGFGSAVPKILKAFVDILKIGISNIIIFFTNIGKEYKQDRIEITGGGYRKFTMMIIMATISTGLVGIFGRELSFYMSDTVLFPGIGLVVTGVLLFTTDGIPRGKVTTEEATYFSAFIIGIVQGFSVLPGMARSGMVIACCLLFGYKTNLVWKFTYLVALPSLAGSVIVDIVDVIINGAGDFNLIGWYLLAGVLAIITGYIGLLIVNRVLKRGKFLGFAIYCLVIGAFALASIIVMGESGASKEIIQETALGLGYMINI